MFSPWPTRKDVLELPEALHRLELASRCRFARSRPAASGREPWFGRSTSGIAAYDTLFVELADREAIPLATFDEPVIRAFPRIAMRPRKVPAA
jgi:hypothetical protein